MCGSIGVVRVSAIGQEECSKKPPSVSPDSYGASVRRLHRTESAQEVVEHVSSEKKPESPNSHEKFSADLAKDGRNGQPNQNGTQRVQAQGACQAPEQKEPSFVVKPQVNCRDGQNRVKSHAVFTSDRQEADPPQEGRL